jgi:hypothetical protein
MIGSLDGEGREILFDFGPTVKLGGEWGVGNHRTGEDVPGRCPWAMIIMPFQGERTDGF